MLVYFEGSGEPLLFDVDADEPSDEDGLEHGELNQLLADLEGLAAWNEFVHFTDTDGEEAFFMYLRGIAPSDLRDRGSGQSQ